jgi:hypothetical protein
MATGYWWNGYEYHESEHEARRRAEVVSRTRDAQSRRDMLWFLVATETVLPVAVLPYLGLGAGIYPMVTPGPAVWYGLAAVIAGLLLAPFAWRVVGPVASRFLGHRRPPLP